MKKNIAVIGAGQMGAGIAQVSAKAGFNVYLYDISQQSLDKGINSIKTLLEKGIEKGKVTLTEKENILTAIKTTTDLNQLKDSDLAIEAIVEKFEVKKELFENLDELLPSASIIASNTSSISITKLASTVKRSDKVIGMHFMNPVPVMKLVEVIRGLQTSDETYEAIKSVCEAMEKTTVLGVDSAGFIVNRILCPMINEAIFLLQEGVTPQDIDNAMMLGTNQPMGPLTLADFVGLDTLLYILQILHQELGEDKYRPCPLLIKYVEAGWYGRKTKRGFYKY